MLSYVHFLRRLLDIISDLNCCPQPQFQGIQFKMRQQGAFYAYELWRTIVPGSHVHIIRMLVIQMTALHRYVNVMEPIGRSQYVPLESS